MSKPEVLSWVIDLSGHRPVPVKVEPAALLRVTQDGVERSFRVTRSRALGAGVFRVWLTEAAS